MREGLAPAGERYADRAGELAGVVARLEHDGLVRIIDGRARTTRRWQGAMARAAIRLLGAGDAGDDLRVPVACALIELYPDDLDDDTIVRLSAAMLPIEHGELVGGRGR